MQSPLRNIARLAHELTHLTAPLVTSQHEKPTASTQVVSLDLRCPPSFRPRFQNLAVSDDVISELVQAFDKLAEDLREICTAKFEESCRGLTTIRYSSRCPPLPDLTEKLRYTYQHAYEKLLLEWINDRIPALSTRVAQSTIRQVKSSTSKFNCVCVAESFILLSDTRMHRNTFHFWKNTLSSTLSHHTQTSLFLRGNQE